MRARKLGHGHRSVRTQVSAHLLRACRADRVSWRHRHPHDADRHLSANQHPGRDDHLELHRPQHARDGAAGLHLQPVFDQLQRQRHQGHGVADAQRHLGAEDLLPAGRQSRPRHRADRLGHECHPCAHAARHPAADHRAIQCLERARAAAHAHLGQSQRAAALRLRHLSPAPTIGAGARRYLSHAGRRKIPPDHGRYRPEQVARTRADARSTW